MIDSETVVGTGLRITVSKDELAAKLGVVARGVSTRTTVVVPGKLLLDIARSLPDSDVTIEHKPEEAVVVVTAGTANYRLHTYSSEDFPRLPEIDDAGLHGIDREALVETVARV